MSELLSVKRLSALIAAQAEVAWYARTGCAWIEMQGTDCTDLLHRLSTNDITALVPSLGVQTVLLTEKARIIDVLTILQGNKTTHLIGSPSSAPATIKWLRKYVIMDDVLIRDLSSTVDMIEVCGPKAASAVYAMLETDVSKFTMCQWTSCLVDGSSVVIVRMPSSVEMSYWIIGAHKTISDIANMLRSNQEGIPELSPDEFQYLRIMSGLGEVGHEWTDAYNPLEAGLLHLTSFTKGCYIGQEVVARLDTYNKVKQRVMGLISQKHLSVGDVIMAVDTPIGKVTSTTQSFDGQTTFALGYVRGEHANPHTRLSVVHEGNIVDVEQMIPPMKDVSCQ